MLTHYLTKNRLKINMLSITGWKYLAKRILLLKRLINADLTCIRLRKKGSRIEAFAIIYNTEFEGNPHNLSVGAGSFIGKNTFVQLHGEVNIGCNVAINDSVKILTGSHDINDPNWKLVTASVIIGDNAWIATNSIILPGVVIGEGAVVGAGSVVTSHVEPFTVVAGNPARAIKKRMKTIHQYSPIRSSAIVEAWMGK